MRHKFARDQEQFKTYGALDIVVIIIVKLIIRPSCHIVYLSKITKTPQMLIY